MKYFLIVLLAMYSSISFASSFSVALDGAHGQAYVVTYENCIDIVMTTPYETKMVLRCTGPQTGGGEMIFTPSYSIPWSFTLYYSPAINSVLAPFVDNSIMSPIVLHYENCRVLYNRLDGPEPKTYLDCRTRS